MISIKYFHPFNLIGFSRPSSLDTIFDPSNDTYEYGFSLDLTTELFFYTYDWGYGLNFRLLGFGFEICKVGC
jgi:hypothetical protein